MQKGSSEIAVVQISRTEYITKSYRNMVDQIPQKRILRPTSSWSTRELPLEQNLNLHKVGDPIKKHTDLFKYGYIPYV